MFISKQATPGAGKISRLVSYQILVVLILGAAPVQGQDSGAVALEEIVVTATKRGDQVLQDISVAVQAYTGEDIADYVATEFIELAPFISSLQLQDLGPGDKEYIIRGVNSTATATVGVYFDEAIITARTKQDGGGRQADIELHDLARVEVLKGPQGTLFGASSLSGTIRYIPNAPDPTGLDANIGTWFSSTEDGDFNWHADGMVNIPVVANVFALRAVGWVTREDGWIDNTLLGNEDINDNELEGGRLAGSWFVNEGLTLSAFGLIQNRQVGGGSRQMPILQDTFADNFATFSTELAALGFVQTPAAKRTTQSFTVTDWDEDLTLAGLKIDYDTDWGSFLLATSRFEREIDFNFDSTPILLFFGVPVPAITAQPQKRELWSTELRFASNLEGPVQFVAGGFISREDKDFATHVIATGSDGRPLAPFEPGDPNTIFGRAKTDALDQEALFGEVEWTINDSWSALLGARWYQFDIESRNSETQPFGGTPSLVPVQFNLDDDEVTFKGNLTYRLNDDQLVYATINEGFRPGGTNDIAFLAPGDPIPPAGFGPDSLTNYEVGWKTAWSDNRVTVNGAVFFIDWQDIQVSTFEPGTPFNVVRNEGEAEVTGIELEINARPVDGLDLYLGGSWQNAEFTSDIPGSSPGTPFAVAGQDIPNVPDFQVGATGQYTWPAFQQIDALVRLEYSYRSDTLIAPNDPILNVDLDSFSLVNLKFGLQTDRWLAAIFVKNLFDEDAAAFDAINSTQDPRAIVTARPRTIGLQLRYNFDYQ